MLFKLSWTLESNINFSNLFYEATKLELNSDMAVQKQKTIINCPYEYGYKNPRWLLANRTQPCTWSVTLWPCVICSRKDNLIQSQEFWQRNLLQEIKGQSYIINAENLFYKIISHFLIKMLNKISKLNTSKHQKLLKNKSQQLIRKIFSTNIREKALISLIYKDPL